MPRHSDSLIPNGWVESQIRPDCCAALAAQAPRDFAGRIVEISEGDRVMASLGAGIHTGCCSFAAINPMHAECAAFHRSFASRGMWLLIVEYLMHERAGLERTGHHAVPAADAGMFVDQNDAVRTDEGSLGGTYVDAGWIFAMLAKHGQRMHISCAAIAQVNLANPLRIGRRASKAAKSVLLITSVHAGAATLGAAVCINQKSPSVTFGLACRAGWQQAYSGYDRQRCQRGNGSGDEAPPRQLGAFLMEVSHGKSLAGKPLPSIQADMCGVGWCPEPWDSVPAGRSRWHSKQSMRTALKL